MYNYIKTIYMVQCHTQSQDWDFILQHIEAWNIKYSYIRPEDGS